MTEANSNLELMTKLWHKLLKSKTLKMEFASNENETAFTLREDGSLNKLGILFTKHKNKYISDREDEQDYFKNSTLTFSYGGISESIDGNQVNGYSSLILNTEFMAKEMIYEDLILDLTR